MTFADLDLAVYAVVAGAIGLGVVALVAIYISMPSPGRAFEPPPGEGTVVRCYCYNRPIEVKVVRQKTRRRGTVLPPATPAEPTRRGRHARPRGTPVDTPAHPPTAYPPPARPGRRPSARPTARPVSRRAAGA